MNEEIEKLIKNSTKAELLEVLAKELEHYDKAIVILVHDKDNGGFESQSLMLGIWTLYEAVGMLDISKNDIQDDYYANID